MTTKQVKKRIRASLSWWMHWLGLGYWQVELVFSRDQVDQSGGYVRAGLCECDWKYQTATITMYPRQMRHLKASQIEHAVLHELMHIFLSEMHEGEMHHEERVATSLEKAFMWVKEAKEKP